jgi:hypothetical protein
MAEIIINERQLEIIQDLITKEENLKLAEQNWAKFNDKQKETVVEMMKVLHPKKAMLIKEDKWYNTLGDVVGIFDPTGVVDAINGLSYINQGDYLFGFLSFVSAIPYAGDLIAKPVMGALKIGAPSAKALNGVMKLSKAGKSAEAAAELAKISKSGGIVGSFVSGVGKYAGKLKDLVKRVPMPGGMKRTITQWIELFEKGAVKGKTVRYGAGVFAKNMPKLTKAQQVAGLEKLIKASKESGLFTSYRTTKGLFSWKTIFRGMPQLIGRNASVRSLMRQTKLWAGFLDFLGLANFVGPDEALKQMGQEQLESKFAEYQKTPQAQEYAQESFGDTEIPDTQTQQSTSTSSKPASSKNPIGDFFSSIFGGTAKGEFLAAL